MREKEIRKLIKIVEESNIEELEVSRWGKKVRISKRRSNRTEIVSPAAPSAAVESIPEVIPKEEGLEKAAAEAQEKETGKERIEIRSPMVGTFYRAPAPGADPYVEVGDHITPGQTLCIIEAMKLMNEIEAEIGGTILEILVENAQPVEYNQPLFFVEKD